MIFLLLLFLCSFLMGMDDSKVPSLGVLALHSLHKGNERNPGLTLQEIKKQLSKKIAVSIVKDIFRVLVVRRLKWLLGEYELYDSNESSYIIGYIKEEKKGFLEKRKYICINTKTGKKYKFKSKASPLVSNDGKVACTYKALEKYDLDSCKGKIWHYWIAILNNEGKEIDVIDMKPNFDQELYCMNENMIVGTRRYSSSLIKEKELWAYDFKTKRTVKRIIKDDEGLDYLYPIGSNMILGLPYDDSVDDEDVHFSDTYVLINVFPDEIRINDPVYSKDLYFLSSSSFQQPAFYKKSEKKIEVRKIDMQGNPGPVKYTLPCTKPYDLLFVNGFPVIYECEKIKIPNIRLQSFEEKNLFPFMGGFIMEYETNKFVFEDANPQTLGAWLWCAKQNYINEENKLLPVIGKRY